MKKNLTPDRAAPEQPVTANSCFAGKKFRGKKFREKEFREKKSAKKNPRKKIGDRPRPWSQSYDFGIYNYNASVVVAYIAFHSRIKYFCFQNALGYTWRCKNLQSWRCKFLQRYG
jgi:hypothetical protein